MSLTYEQLRRAPEALAHRTAELIAERAASGAGIPRPLGDEISRVRDAVGDEAWTAVVGQSPDVTLAQVDAVALALGTAAEWLMGSDTAPRSRPSLEAELVAGMRRHDLSEADVAEAVGISRDELEHAVASPHLTDHGLVADLLRVLA